MSPGGSFTQLAGSVSSASSGDIIKLTVVGNVLTLYRNGAQISTATDSTYTSGSPGIGWNWYSYTPTIDDWEGGNIVTDAPAPIAGDLNSDGSVNMQDVLIIVNDFGKTSGFNPAADLSAPFNSIDIFDVMVVVRNWE